MAAEEEETVVAADAEVPAMAVHQVLPDVQVQEDVVVEEALPPWILNKGVK